MTFLVLNVVIVSLALGESRQEVSILRIEVRPWIGARGANPAASAEEGIRVGVATIDITPEGRVPLGGYGDRLGKLSTGVHDGLFAKAIVIESKSEKVAVVGTDLIGVSPTFRRELLSRLPDSVGIKARNLLLTATHTHSATGGVEDNILAQVATGFYREDLRKDLLEKVAKVITDANSALAPSRIGFAVKEVQGLSRNRRKDDGPTDPELRIIRFDDLEGNPVALLANFTAHPTVLGSDNMLVSGDYPGFFQAELEALMCGPDSERRCVALFTNGAEGDQGPNAPPGKDDFERAEKMGKALAKEAADLSATITTGSDLTIEIAYSTPKLPDTLWKLLLPNRTILQVIRLNDVALVAIPGEMCVEIGLEIKKNLKEQEFQDVFLIGLANDHLGYFVTPEMFEEGGYEPSVSFYGTGMADFLTRKYALMGEKISPRRKKADGEVIRAERFSIFDLRFSIDRRSIL